MRVSNDILLNAKEERKQNFRSCENKREICFCTDRAIALQVAIEQK